MWGLLRLALIMMMWKWLCSAMVLNVVVLEFCDWKKSKEYWKAWPVLRFVCVALQHNTTQLLTATLRPDGEREKTTGWCKLSYGYRHSEIMFILSRFLARIFAIGSALCIINDLGGWLIIGVVNYTCLSCKFLIVAMQRSKAKQRLVKGQLTLFVERASSDTDNLAW